MEGKQIGDVIVTGIFNLEDSPGFNGFIIDNKENLYKSKLPHSNDEGGDLEDKKIEWMYIDKIDKQIYDNIIRLIINIIQIHASGKRSEDIVVIKKNNISIGTLLQKYSKPNHILYIIQNKDKSGYIAIKKFGGASDTDSIQLYNELEKIRIKYFSMIALISDSDDNPAPMMLNHMNGRKVVKDKQQESSNRINRDRYLILCDECYGK